MHISKYIKNIANTCNYMKLFSVPKELPDEEFAKWKKGFSISVTMSIFWMSTHVTLFYLCHLPMLKAQQP